MKKTKGFTLIELLVVIGIVGLLSTLAVIALNTARERALTAECEQGDRQACTDLKERFDIDIKSGKKTIKIDCEQGKINCRYLCVNGAPLDFGQCLVKCDIKYDKCEYDETR